jgi:hypothetical protein
MPVRFAGLGYRSSENMASLVRRILGVLLSHHLSFGIGGILVGDIKPELRQVIEQPENYRTQFPSLIQARIVL